MVAILPRRDKLKGYLGRDELIIHEIHEYSARMRNINKIRIGMIAF